MKSDFFRVFRQSLRWIIVLQIALFWRFQKMKLLQKINAKPPLHLPNVRNLLRSTERKLFTSFSSSVPRILRCPAGIDRGSQVISVFCSHLGLTDTLDHDLMLLDNGNLDYHKLLYCEFQKYEVMTISVVGGQQKKKNANPSYKATKHTFLISDYYKWWFIFSHFQALLQERFVIGCKSFGTADQRNQNWK